MRSPLGVRLDGTDPRGLRVTRSRRTSSRLIHLAGAVVVLVALAIAALYAVVPGDPDPVDEVIATL